MNAVAIFTPSDTVRFTQMPSYNAFLDVFQRKGEWQSAANCPTQMDSTSAIDFDLILKLVLSHTKLLHKHAHPLLDIFSSKPFGDFNCASVQGLCINHTLFDQQFYQGLNCAIGFEHFGGIGLSASVYIDQAEYYLLGVKC